MADFLKSFERVLRWEGGYVLENVENDRGGMTCTGISRVYNPQWPGWAKIDAAVNAGMDISMELLKPDIHVFYEKEYAPLDKVTSQKIADQIYQAYINCGNVAKKWAQKVCNDNGHNLTIDGIIGMQSLTALNAVDEVKFCPAYYEMQIAYYDAIIKRDSTQQKFRAGWNSRAGAFL